MKVIGNPSPPFYSVISIFTARVVSQARAGLQPRDVKNRLDAARSRRFSGPAMRERVTCYCASPRTLILMGDWCSEKLTPNRMKLRQW
ncbi:MAG TPA: hypothetical protein VLX29_10500 [Nitrospirota bacterium]|nr:hypothetical protein [Nitrospirota bacterium]